jgi:aminoglycoside phosphotransferase (APT) family kinase protein
MEPVPDDLIRAMCQRAFGDDAHIVCITRIGVGTYNSTYRLDLAGRAPVVLRVGPQRARQGRTDRDGMRNDYAAAPYLVALGPLAPRVLAADFTHQLVARDYMFQNLLPGVPAETVLDSYTEQQRAAYFGQLGSITRVIHDVRGPWFGRVAGPGYDTWSAALVAQFEAMAADFTDADLDPTDVIGILAAVQARRAVLDQISEPRLLHGDLWRLNILLDPDAAAPAITGVLDADAALWGDPLADWTIHRVQQLASTDADAFWHTYRRPVESTATALRQLFYQARNRAGVRLDIHRRGIDPTTVPPMHWDLTTIVSHLEK